MRLAPADTRQAVGPAALRIRHMAEQYGAMAEPVSHRIIRSILRLRQQFGETLPVTHRELAQMSWTTTESAIRAVRQLKRQGALIGRRGQLTVVGSTTELRDSVGRPAHAQSKGGCRDARGQPVTA